jgi:cytochrome c-type biogenesis protein CcmH/NrfG
MTDAADREDKIEKHIVTPGRLAPARELLGDMLMLAKRPADALRAYEQSQVREPNRFRGYLGAALAAEAAGDATTAKAYFAKLLDLAKDADSGRAEIARARAYVTR